MTVSNSPTNRQWLLASYAPKTLTLDNFELRETPLEMRELADGEILVRNRIVSVGPSTRGRLTGYLQNRVLPPIALGTPITSVAESEVIASNNPDFPTGSVVWGMAAWEDYTYVQPARALTFLIPPELAARPQPLHLNMLTAYFGLTKIGQPKAGETVVVSAAAGSVGFNAAQFARALGCRVIGIAGGPEKTRALVEEGRLDAAIDYQNEDVHARLRALCPEGVDIYFDNVGNDVIDTVVELMNVHARVVISGQIARYDARGAGIGLSNFSPLVANRIRIEGFVVFDYAAEFRAALVRIASLIDSGQVSNRLDLREGFERLPQGFLDLFTGANSGSLLVRLGELAGEAKSAPAHSLHLA